MHRHYIQQRRPKAAVARHESFTESSDLSVFGRLVLVVTIFVAAIAAFNHLLG